MNILITGGLGTIGRVLAKECRQRGHRVTTCDLYHATHQRSFSTRTDEIQATYVRCDVGDYRQLERVFVECGPFDLVYHCAAEFGRWNGEDYYEQLWHTNAVGTKNLIRLQERMRFRMVFFSSSEVYGDYDDTMSEAVMQVHAIPQLNDYAMSKWVGEMQVRNSAHQYGTETVIVRLFNTYGPGEYYSPYRSVNCRFLYCALHGLPWTVHRYHYRTSTYVTDTVHTLVNLVDRFYPGEVYNLGGNEYHSIEGLSNLVLELTGASKDLVTYADQEMLTTKVKRPDSDKAHNDLGHRGTISLRTGMLRTALWMADVYKDTLDESLNLHGDVQQAAHAASDAGEYLPAASAF